MKCGDERLCFYLLSLLTLSNYFQEPQVYKYSLRHVKRILKSFGMKYAYQRDYRMHENAEEELNYNHTIATPYSTPVMASAFRSSFRNSLNNSRAESAQSLKLVFASSSSTSSLLGTPNCFTVAQFLSK